MAAWTFLAGSESGGPGGDDPTNGGTVLPHSGGFRFGAPLGIPGPSFSKDRSRGFANSVSAPDRTAIDGNATLRYHSRIGQNRSFGNWWFSWDIYVIPQGNGDLKIYKPGRAGDVYVWDAVNQKYVSPPGYFDQMVQNSDGTWTRTTKHGFQWHFNTAGYLDWAQDRYGLRTTVNRNSSNQVQILSIVDHAGRTTTVAYNASGYATSISDWGGAITSFTYTTQGYLNSITYPSTTYYDRATSAIVTRGKTISFQYTANSGNPSLDGNLTSITDDRGQVALSVFYDTQDRVQSQVVRGGTWAFQYGSATTVTDPDGITVAYSFNARGAITRKEVFTKTGLGQTPLRTGEPNSYVWLYARSAPCNCDLVTQVTRPDASTKSLTYDTWGNMTIRVNAPPSGSSAPTRTETWTWSGFSQFCRVLSLTTAMGNAPGATAAHYTTTWTYDSQGNATTISLRKAMVSGTLVHPTITATYNSYGQPLSVTCTNGSVNQYTYDSGTLTLAQEVRDCGTGKLNITTQYAYDSYGRCTTTTDPRGNNWTIQYNALDQVTQVQGPGTAAGRLRLTYDNNNNLYSREVENLDASGNPVAANPWFTHIDTYDVNNRLTMRAVEVDVSTTATTQYQYTAGNRLWKSTSPVGDVVERLTDERGLLFKQTDGAGTSVAGTTTINYDLNGYPAQVVNPRGYTWNIGFNHEGWYLSTVDPAGVSEILTRSLDRRVTKFERTNAQSVPVARVQYEWDPYGLRLSTARHLLDAQGSTTQALATNYSYDSNLQLATIADALGNARTRSHDAVGRLTQEQDAATNKAVFSYDANGNVTSVARHAWNQATQAYDVVVFDSQFDALNRRTQTTRRDQGTTLSTTRNWAYDSRENALDRTDELGNTSHHEYDGRGLLTKVTHDLRAGGNGSGQVVSTIVTLTTFDLAGRVTARRDGLNQQTTWAYDARGRVISETNAASGTWSFTHDANWNVATITDPLGTVVTNTFDSRDLLTARSVSRASGVLGTTSESYAYDAAGQRLTAVDDDSTVQYSFDSLGRAFMETEGPNPLGGQGKAFSYVYNPVDSIVGVTFPDGAVETRGHDVAQRLTSVALQGGPTLASYQYSGSRVVQLGLQNGVTRTSTHDLLWRDTMVEYKQGTTSLKKFQYVFNAANYRLLEKRHHASGSGDNYALDSLYRTVQVKEGVADPVAEYQNPGSQSLVRTVAPAYDAVQNRTQVTVTPSGGSPTTTSYSKDSLNFYTAIGGTTHVRDANGNLRDDGTRLYAYDYLNQLCRVTDKATSTVIAEYRYDALGRRIERTTASSSRSYYWAFAAMAAEYDSSGLFARRHFGGTIDEIVGASQRDIADLNGNGITTDSVWLTPCYDGSSDCVAVVGPSGAVVESYLHTYEGVVSITNAAGQPLSASAIGWQQGYGGMHRDDETGLLYARYRYYLPSIGRWITEDPNGQWHDWNNVGSGYAWVANAYRNALDPWGLAYVRIDAVGHGGGMDAERAAREEDNPSGTFQTGSIVEAIDLALKRLGPCDCIEAFYINCHGFPGGFDMSNTGADDVNASNVASGAVGDAFKRLGDRLCNLGYETKIIITACKAGKGGGGDLLRGKLKALTGTETVGASDGNVPIGQDRGPGYREE